MLSHNSNFKRFRHLYIHKIYIEKDLHYNSLSQLVSYGIITIIAISSIVINSFVRVQTTGYRYTKSQNQTNLCVYQIKTHIAKRYINVDW